MKPKPILKYVGFALLILGTAFNIYIYVIQAWPTYLYFVMMAIGVLLLLLSFFCKNLKTIWQTLIAALPFLAAVVLYQIDSASSDIFLIQKDFRGKVTVYYNQQNGQEERYEGKWRVYNIPLSGILDTKFKLKAHKISYSKTKYFFVDSLNNRTEIKTYCDLCKDRDTISVQVIFGDLGLSDKGTYQTFSIKRPSNGQ